MSAPMGPSLFSIVQGVKPAPQAVTPPPAFPLNVPGRAAGGDVQLPTMYDSIGAGPPAPAPAPAPPGGSPGMMADDPLAPILMQIAQQYSLVDANGQPDLAAAQKIYDQNPSMYMSGGAAAPDAGGASLGGAGQMMPAAAQPMMPNIPGRIDGGMVSVAGYEGGTPVPTTVNPGSPGYVPTPTPTLTPDSGFTFGQGNIPVKAPYAAPTNPYTGPFAISTGSAPSQTSGGDQTGGPDDFWINMLVNQGSVATFGQAADMWNNMSPDDKVQFQQAWRINNGLADKSGGSDGSAYASIAEKAAEFQQQLAFNREQEAARQAEARQSVAANIEKAKQDFYFNREALATQRKQTADAAVTSALNAWSQNVGQANIPGMANMHPISDPAGADAILGNAPILNYNPLQAYGQQLNQPADIPAPNIPGIDYGRAA